METPLQSASLTADDLTASILPDYEEEAAEEEGHVHLPGPSLWPLILSVAVFVTISGFLLIDSTPLISIIGAVFILVGIIGWGLENPEAPAGKTAADQAIRTAEYAPTPYAQEILDQAEGVVENMVTVGSTAWSAHPVSVEIEQEGVVLALYGKVELEAQKEALEAELLKLPNVIGVKNFIVAEDAILNAANARIARLQEAGKLEGAKDINIQVENYIISLYGEVPTRDMKYMLENELINIPGVRVVINHIGLNEEIPGNLGKTRNKVGK